MYPGVSRGYILNKGLALSDKRVGKSIKTDVNHYFSSRIISTLSAHGRFQSRINSKMAMSPTKSSGKAAKKAGKAQKSVLNKSGEKVRILSLFNFKRVS